VTLREELLEQHWSYMDRYRAQMIARGPALASDGGAPTGSVHIAGLPDPAAACAFAFDEPSYQARGVPGCAAAPVAQPAGAHHVGLPRQPGRWSSVSGARSRRGPAAGLAMPPDRDELIAYGPLLSGDGATWLGTAVLARARDPDAARAILTPDRYAVIEVHNWQFGGRPS
jgi:uncharacterized protein